MIDRSVFYERLEGSCKSCEHWRGVCLKGHELSSPEGCPIQKFSPVGDAGYAPERVAASPAPKLHDCCGSNSAMPPLTWARVLVSFTKSMVKWIAAGVPLVGADVHGQRYNQCKSCEEFRDFYCRQCRCVCFLKTKMQSEVCPKGKW